MLAAQNKYFLLPFTASCDDTRGNNLKLITEKFRLDIRRDLNIVGSAQGGLESLEVAQECLDIPKSWWDLVKD